jgi:hypothetical protein
MTRVCFLAYYVACLSALPLPVMCGETPATIKEWPIRIKYSGSLSKNDGRKGELCVLDGDLMFLSGQSGGGPGTPPLPGYSLRFLWEGPLSGPGLLRVKIGPRNTIIDREGKVSKELAARDGWYVTANLTADPAQVVLTKEPITGSRWVQGSADRPGYYLLKNVDAPGEAVWLTMEAKEKVYRGGVARKPILSNEKCRFFIDDAN